MKQFCPMFTLGLVAMGLVAILAAGPARCENFDAGKSGATLFRTNCSTCHHSPRGLAKQRIPWLLGNYLQQHYTTNRAQADILAAYVVAADVKASTGTPRAVAGGRPRTARSKPGALRPPTDVPGH